MAKPQTIHTIESLLARTVEMGTCMEWTGSLRNHTPMVFHNGKMKSVRRIICAMQNRTVPAGYFVSNSCGDPKCIHPSHIVFRSPSAHAKAMCKAIDYQNPTRRIKLAESAQVRRKLTDEQLQTILSGEQSCTTLAKEFKVNKAVIAKVRRGEAHCMTIARNNPFWSLYG